VGERRRAGTATKGDQREQAILAAAEEQLATTGPDGLTVESLSRAVGITRGAFYFYFGSKDDVLAALVGRTMATLTGEVAAAETIADPATALRRAVDHTAQQWCAFYQAAATGAPGIPAVAATCTAIWLRALGRP
jgi:AcrR family transcriptional regulator